MLAAFGSVFFQVSTCTGSRRSAPRMRYGDSRKRSRLRTSMTSGGSLLRRDCRRSAALMLASMALSFQECPQSLDARRLGVKREGSLRFPGKLDCALAHAVVKAKKGSEQFSGNSAGTRGLSAARKVALTPFPGEAGRYAFRLARQALARTLYIDARGSARGSPRAACRVQACGLRSGEARAARRERRDRD